MSCLSPFQSGLSMVRNVECVHLLSLIWNDKYGVLFGCTRVGTGLEVAVLGNQYLFGLGNSVTTLGN
jgi:hypothetical protein